MSKYTYTQKRNDYLSPPEIVNAALDMFGRTEFDLDVCCSMGNIPAKKYYIEGLQDGLTLGWGNLNWCNPPYNECEKWVKKAAKEAKEKYHTTVMLIPARTETKYWHDYILYEGCTKNPDVSVLFLQKGYKFLNPETREPMGVFKNALALVTFWGYKEGFFARKFNTVPG